MEETKKITKGTNKFNQKMAWLLFGKRLLLSENSNLNCPRCSSSMRKFTKNNVNLDSCDFCGGLWLDNGEIDKLINLSKLTENKSTLNKSIEKIQSVKSIKKVQSKKKPKV